MGPYNADVQFALAIYVIVMAFLAFAGLVSFLMKEKGL